MRIYRNSIIMVSFGENRGSVQKGIRPAVVIQNDLGNKHSTTTIVAPITGKIKKPLPTHHELSSKDYYCLKCDSTNFRRASFNNIKRSNFRYYRSS